MRAGFCIKRNQSLGGWHHATHNPHGFARAARGHARLGYAGGSRRSPQPVDGGDPGPAGIFYRKSFARNFGQGRNRHRRNDANHKSHVPARLLDVIGERAVVVIDGMAVDGAVSVSVRNDVAVGPARVMERKAEVVVAGVSSCGFGCGNADTLERKGERRRHHHDDGEPS